MINKKKAILVSTIVVCIIIIITILVIVYAYKFKTRPDHNILESKVESLDINQNLSAVTINEVRIINGTNGYKAIINDKSKLEHIEDIIKQCTLNKDNINDEIQVGYLLNS